MKSVYVCILLSLVFFNVSYANENDYGVTVSIGSKHFIERDDEYAYNESNPGVGIVYYFSDDNSRAVMFGTYKNSDYKDSIYAAYKMYSKDFIEDFANPYLMIGIASGYDNGFNGIIPTLITGFDFHVIKDNKFNLLIAPLASETGENKERHYGFVLGFQYEHLF